MVKSFRGAVAMVKAICRLPGNDTIEADVARDADASGLRSAIEGRTPLPSLTG